MNRYQKRTFLSLRETDLVASVRCDGIILVRPLKVHVLSGSLVAVLLADSKVKTIYCSIIFPSYKVAELFK